MILVSLAKGIRGNLRRSPPSTCKRKGRKEFLRTSSSVTQSTFLLSILLLALIMSSESPHLNSRASNPGTPDQTGASTAESAKRKAEQPGNGGTHTRTKRNRYISIAWYDSGSSLTLALILRSFDTRWISATSANILGHLR